MKTRLLFPLLLLAAAACDRAASTSAPAPAPAQTAASAQPVQPVQPVQPAPAAPAATPQKPVLATADGEKSGTRIEVRELKRSSDDTVMLKLEIYNGSSNTLELHSYYLGDKDVNSDYRAIGGIHLVDGANKKKYFTVRDSEKVCQCSRELDDVPPQGSVNVWARFPAPPADVTSLSVVVPHFSPMDGVPLS